MFRKYIEGFHGGQDCQRLVFGSASPAQCRPRAVSRLPVGSSRCKIPLRNSRGAPEFDFLSNPSLTAAFPATSGTRDTKALAFRVCLTVEALALTIRSVGSMDGFRVLPFACRRKMGRACLQFSFLGILRLVSTEETLPGGSAFGVQSRASEAWSKMLFRRSSLFRSRLGANGPRRCLRGIHRSRLTGLLWDYASRKGRRVTLVDAVPVAPRALVKNSCWGVQ